MRNRAAVDAVVSEVRVDSAIARELLELCGTGEGCCERVGLRWGAEGPGDVSVALG